MNKGYHLILIGVLCMLVMPVYGMAGEKVFEASPLFGSLSEGERGAILMVHFGTTHDDTRARTLDALNHAMAEAFPSIEVREAYSSRIVQKRLRDRGIIKQSPIEAMKALHDEGVTHLLVVPSQVIYGLEMKSLAEEVEEMSSSFREIRLTTPLLFYHDDYKRLVDEVMAKDLKPETAYIYVGHGTYDSSTAQYAMLDHYLMDRGLSQVIVGCIEGYPFYEQALKRLRGTGLKKVIVRPLMMVAGEHAKNDILQEWGPELEKEGFEVTVEVKGLGELPEVQRLVTEKAKFFSKNRRILIGEKKRIYVRTGEKLTSEDE